MPPTPDLSFSGLDVFANKSVVENSTAKSSEEEPKVDCKYHQKQFQIQRMVKPVWNNAQRVNHQNFAKKTHPCAKKYMVPRAVLMKSCLVSVNTDRQVNAAHSKTTVNAARPMPYLFKIAHSTVKRPINKNTTFKNRNPQIDIQDLGVIDSGCTRHVTRNMDLSTNSYEEDRWQDKLAYMEETTKERENHRKMYHKTSVARTPQQNKVAERMNRILIEAARTMLADSKTPTLSFMRPFGCPVTILNTIDHLGKFDGKADEGFFIGYSLNSKAFRVFNSRIRIVEENMHI
ncbi:ribonuclease H-like domain-containing protein, partial [Tanacetum coccineum]